MTHGKSQGPGDGNQHDDNKTLGTVPTPQPRRVPGRWRHRNDTHPARQVPAARAPRGARAACGAWWALRTPSATTAAAAP